MSRSRKKHAIVKDKTGRWYNRIIRRHQNQEIRGIKTLADLMDYRISHPYEIVNQWDICDWIFRYDNDEEWAERLNANRWMAPWWNW